MMPWMGGFGFGWIFMALVWLLIVLGVIALVRWLLQAANHRHEERRKTPLEILQERYARGEIERGEYEQKRRDLEE